MYDDARVSYARWKVGHMSTHDEFCFPFKVDLQFKIHLTIDEF